MNRAPPFVNDYLSRRVSDTDSKSCLICYKPTTTVLISSNKVDFFYVCPSHLSDEHFATPIKPQAYQDLVKEKATLQEKVDTLTKELEVLKPYLWNSLKSYLPGKAAKEPKTDTDQAAGTAAKSSKYESILKELKETQTKLDVTSEDIVKFAFKQFSLHQEIYRQRIQNYLKIKHNRSRNQKIQEGLLFPEVPKNELK